MTGPLTIGPRQIGLSPDGLIGGQRRGDLAGGLSVFQRYRGVIGPSGQANAAIGIPAIPALVGVTIHSAFVTADAAAPFGIRSISNTVSLTVVP